MDEYAAAPCVKPAEPAGKAALCSAPNFSMLDGWWVEGYNGNNRWVIGEETVSIRARRSRTKPTLSSIYRSLKRKSFRSTTAGMNRAYRRLGQSYEQSIISLTPTYSTQRMVIDYRDKYYMPAAINGAAFVADDRVSASACRLESDGSAKIGMRCGSRQPDRQDYAP